MASAMLGVAAAACASTATAATSPSLPASASTSLGDPGAFLQATEALRIRDHATFAKRLAQLHTAAVPLTAGQTWYLRYLDAWEASFEGRYGEAREELRNVAEHSGDLTLAAKASALLMNNESIAGRYEEAYTLANRLAGQLPQIQDPTARVAVLQNLSQTLNSAGQTDLAIRYARTMRDASASPATLCYSYSLESAALYTAKKLVSSSPDVTRTIDTCTQAGQPVITAMVRLVKAALLIEERRPSEALALLDRIAPDIYRNRYFVQIPYLQVEKAQALERLGRDEQAVKAAKQALDTGGSSGASEVLRDAYGVLYRIEKKQGNLADALGYYEKYAAQDKGYVDEVGARAIAYQKVQQRLLSRKLETEELSKQNSILKLQQELDAKAVETGRLYIVLLLIGLTAIVLWLLRLKHSQLRFKRMATRDGLTGILNHQHFINESERQLRQLERRGVHASLLWMDLDHFKQINDTHGHAAGDAVLRHIVKVCNDHLRPGDLFGRLGGEEFGILLLECERDHAIAIADRIRLAIEGNPLDHEGTLLKVSASIGVASSGLAGHALQRLCRRADAALYRAKRDGRNRVVADAGEGTSVFA